MDLDPDRKLALAYVPAAARPAVEALWRLDASFAAILATGTQPLISQMRLAWWREALERLDAAPPPAEPVLQALAAHVLPKVSGAELAAMEEGWPTCSISSELQALAMEEGFDDLDAPVLRVTNVDVPLPYAANLEKLALIKVADVVAAAKKVCYR